MMFANLSLSTSIHPFRSSISFIHFIHPSVHLSIYLSIHSNLHVCYFLHLPLHFTAHPFLWSAPISKTGNKQTFAHKEFFNRVFLQRSYWTFLKPPVALGFVPSCASQQQASSIEKSMEIEPSKSVLFTSSSCDATEYLTKQFALPSDLSAALELDLVFRLICGQMDHVDMQVCICAQRSQTVFSSSLRLLLLLLLLLFSRLAINMGGHSILVLLLSG